MMLIIYSDFGAGSPYAGQMEAVCADLAPEVPRVVLSHDAPRAKPRAAGLLLAGLVARMPQRAVFLCVVDPGVGTVRRPLIAQCDNRWFVGPDNGLMVAAAGENAAWFRIDWRPAQLSNTFHGRDLFAPVAAGLALGKMPAVTPIDDPIGLSMVGGLQQIVFVDRFGNLITGIEEKDVAPRSFIVIGDRRIPAGRCFGDVPSGDLFWYGNSMGLVEIAANGSSAAVLLGADVGSVFQIETGEG
ncbi:MAG: SAM-dependent chlorinase/fluorinase [Mariprofundales bacterium]